MAKWSTLKPLAATETATQSITTKAGLFGNDLYNFYRDCASAGTTICNAGNYNKYNGWAIGINWTWKEKPANNALTGVCFDKTKNCIKIKTYAANKNII